MKRLLLTFFALISWVAAQSQATQVWCENFDGGTISTTSTGTPGFNLDANYQVSPANCIKGEYAALGTSTLTSPVFSTLGQNFVVLEFWQICKIEPSDRAEIEFSLDGGVTWTAFNDDPTKIPAGPGNCFYQGTGAFFLNNNAFSEGSHPVDWLAGQNTAPLNTWWKKETFDVSLSLANQASVQLRFKVTDVFGGMGGRYGWLLDDICVTAAPCELVDPSISAPYPGFPLYTGTVFSLPPYDIYVSIFDQSNISVADLYYTVNGGPTQQLGGLFQLVDSMFAGQLTVGAIGDTICWWVEATDASGCNNTSRYPALGEICFVITDLPSPPFCDNFDGVASPTFSADPASIGTAWVLGAPSGGLLNSPNSPTNVWGCGSVAGNPGYTSNTESYLVSTPLSFATTTVANLKFSHNYDVEDGWDGHRIEYSLDNGTTWNILGVLNDPNGTNWYNTSSINSSGVAAWEGTSNGWVQSKYKLATVPGLMGTAGVLFRYVFTSDGSVQQEGTHIDDFCIEVPCNDDIGVTAITAPPVGSGQPSGSSSTITISLENFGQLDQTGFNIGWSIAGVVQAPILYSSTLLAGQVATFNLPSFTVPAGSYDVCIWTELTGDCITTNDTVCGTFIGIPTFTPQPSFCDNFDGANNGWSTLNGPANPAGNNWELGTPAWGATSTTNSGANAWDINLTSAYLANAESYLYSPYFDFSAIGAGRISLAVNYETEANWDGTVLEFTNDNGATWQTVGSNVLPDPCGTNWYNDDNLIALGAPGWGGSSGGWLQASYKLCCTPGIFFNPTPIQFRFRFEADGVIQVDGFSIDDFCIYAAQGDDVGVSAIVSPSGGFPVGTSTPVVVQLENFGGTTITSTPITYTVNGGGTQTIIWTGSLAPCGTVNVTLPPFAVVQGDNIITAWTSLSSDTEPSNDTSSSNVIGQPIISPTYSNWYSDNFDAGNIGWAPATDPTADQSTIWEFGTPAFGQTTGSYTPPTCWDVNLNSAVSGNAICWVTSPFFDFTNAQGAVLRFWQNRNIYEFGDEFSIEYQVNSSGNWINLLAPPNPTQVTNWYNNGDSWDDASAGWEQSIYKDVYTAVGGPVLVQFRLKFTSLGFTNGEGVSVDNFEIFVPIPLSVQTVSVTTSVPCQFIYPGQPITFAAPIKNNGINPVFIHNATLVIDGNIVSVDNISYTPGTLAPDSTKTHNFNNTWIASPGFHQVCVYTDTPNGTLDLYQLDDTACATVLVFDSITTGQLPYCTSFETGNTWVTANSFSYCFQNDWQKGTPAKPNLNGAHTGNTAWSTNLTGTYANKDSSGLFSALIRTQQAHCYKMSFYQQYRMEYGSDGGTVHYSDDYGSSWNRLDFTGTPNMQLFGASPNYTYVSELDPSDPAARGFTGNRNSWFYTEKTFRPDIDGQIVIRWRFASDFSVVDEGWDIDDFCFEDLGVCAPIGVDEFAINNFGLSQNYPNPAEDNTTFELSIPEAGQVRIVLSDILGQVIEVIADENMGAGVHTIRVNTSSIAPGLYTYTMTYQGEQLTKRMMIAR